MHQYRTELRVRLGLERLETGGDAPETISAVAYDLGFASHAHFVRVARHCFGVTPSAIRHALSAAATPS